MKRQGKFQIPATRNWRRKQEVRGSLLGRPFPPMQASIMQISQPYYSHPKPGLTVMFIERGLRTAFILSRAVLARDSCTYSGARLRICCVIEATIYLFPVSKNVAERVPHTMLRCYFRFGDDGSPPYSFHEKL